MRCAPDPQQRHADHLGEAPPDAPRPVMLTILDGFGWRTDTADNAVAQARTNPPGLAL